MTDTKAPGAPGIDRSSTGFRLAASLAAGLVWTAVLVGAWALQSPTHTQVTGFVELEDGGFERVLETTECNTLFASDARDESVALPDFEFGFDFSRAPCEKLHSDSRILFVMNAAVIVGLAVAWTFWFLRWRRRTT